MSQLQGAVAAVGWTYAETNISDAGAFAAEGSVIYTRSLFCQELLIRSAIVHAEAHIPAEPSPPLQDARVPCPHENQGRAGSACATPRQGTKARLGETGLPRVVAAAMARPEVSRVPTAGGASAEFARQARLRKHADFDKVYRTGRRLFSAHMTVFFLRRDAGPARVGFTVTRAMGTAVERNRIRRRLREAVRLNLGAVGSAVDVVIHPKKSAQAADFAELREEIARQFERIRSSAVGSWSLAKDGESAGSK